MENLRLGGVVDHEVRLVGLQLFLGGLDEHVADKMRLPRHFHNEADRHAGILVGAAVGVHDEEALVGELFDGQLFHCRPGLLGGRVVVVLVFVGGPPDRILRILVHDDELVFGGAAGVDAGHDVDRAQLADLALVKAGELRIRLLLKEKVIGRIVNDLSRSGDAVSG